MCGEQEGLKDLAACSKYHTESFLFFGNQVGLMSEVGNKAAGQLATALNSLVTTI